VRVVPKQIAYITNWTSLATKFTPSCRSPSKKKNKKKNPASAKLHVFSI